MTMHKLLRHSLLTLTALLTAALPFAAPAACARALTAAGAEWVAVAGLAASRQNHTLPARPGQPFDLDDAPGEAEDFV